MTENIPTDQQPAIPPSAEEDGPMNLDLHALSDSDLIELHAAVLAEQERRALLADAERQASDLADAWAEAAGRQDGDPWVQPTGAHNAYRLGAEVTHEDKTWISTTPSNVWEPGVTGWREKPAENPDTGEVSVPEFRQPLGDHDAYKKGDKVSFGGVVYESLIDGNVWSPEEYAQGWKIVL